MSGSAPDRLTIAHVVRPHGIRGALLVDCSPDHVAYLEQLPEVILHGGKAKEATYRVRSVSGIPKKLIVALEGVDDRNTSDLLRGATVDARRNDLPELEEGEVYLADLEGCEVFAASDGRGIGRVSAATSLPANVVITIDTADGTQVLAPFINDAVPDVDIVARRLTIDTHFLGLDDTP